MGLRLLLVLLLLASSASATDLGTRAKIRTAAYYLCAVDTNGTSLVPSAFVNDVINIRSHEVARDFHAVPAMDTIITDTLGTRLFELDEHFIAPRWCRRMYVDQLADPPDTGDVSLIYVQDESTFQLLGGLLGTKRDAFDYSKPRYYSVFNDHVMFYPSPAIEDTFVIAYYTSPTALTTDGASTDIEPEFRPYLRLLVAYDILLRMGDYERATQIMMLYNQALATHERDVAESRQDKYLMENK